MSDLEASGDSTVPVAPGLVLPREARSVGLVRRYASDACVTLGWGDSADTVSLLVSEAATNAVLHAHCSEIRVQVVERDERLRVEVFDGSPVMPVRRHAQAGAETGRGLALIDALAVRWDVDRHQDGKTVWFEIGR